MTFSVSPQVVHAQLGAREHYGIPRALASEGMLHSFFTDWWSSPQSKLRYLGDSGRYHAELASHKVTSFPILAMKANIGLRLARHDRLKEYSHHLSIGRSFGQAVCRHLKSSLNQFDVFFSFNTTALEALNILKATQVATIVDQIDPGRYEEHIVHEEMVRWPGWAASSASLPAAYFERLQREWDEATIVVVNSEWSRNGLIQQGVMPEKIHILPLAYEATLSPRPRPSSRNEPLRVLWLGQVILRKGIQYLMDAARILEDEPIEFTVAGPIGISEKFIKQCPPSMKFCGAVPRSEASRFYRKADVFVLPTLSDGFALTQLEAMSYGLPVIATLNCGQVVTPGVDGEIVTAGSSGELAAAVLSAERDRDRTFAMGRNALDTVQRYSIAALAPKLRAVVEQAARVKNGQVGNANA